VCTLDRAVSVDWAVAAAVERFDASIVRIDSGHSPFWSRPSELADLLTG
jgi:hypothetical protein